ncbi:MAG TPA: hypothetical protein VIJ31_12090 [Acidothermaceae bacterium]
MTAEPLAAPTPWRDHSGHHVTHVLLCEHEDDAGDLITYETPIGDAAFLSGFYRWACPFGDFHEAEQ